MTTRGRDAEMLAGDRGWTQAAVGGPLLGPRVEAVAVGQMPGQYASAGQLSTESPGYSRGPSSGARSAGPAFSGEDGVADAADPSTWWG